jgi:broad specificity phosphatase PhoE
MPPTRVMVIRHGQSTWNASGRWQGHADAPLSGLGTAQATSAAAAVPPVEAIWSSDLERARATAAIIGGALGLPVQVDPRLRERNAGAWTGLTRAQIETGWPRYLGQHKRPAGFEDDEAVLARVLSALSDVQRSHPGGEVLVVTHGGVLRALERYCGAIDRAFPNLGGRIFELDGDGAGLVLRAGERLFLLDEDQATYTSSGQQL